MTQEHEEGEVCEKTEGWDEEDVGKRIVKRVTPQWDLLQRTHRERVLRHVWGVLHWTVPRSRWVSGRS